MSRTDRHLDQRFEAMQTLMATEIAALRAEIDAVQQLKAHDLIGVEKRFDQAQEALKAALAASNEAVHRSDTALEKRFESMNDFRSQLRDQAALLLTRAEADARFAMVNDSVAGLLSQSSEFVRRAEHDLLASGMTKVELELKGTTLSAVRHQDLSPIIDAIDKLRDANATSGGKSIAATTFVTVGLAALAILVSFYSAVNNHPDPVPPPAVSSAASANAAAINGAKLDAILRQLELNNDAIKSAAPNR
jgi:hypothetical protein